MWDNESSLEVYFFKYTKLAILAFLCYFYVNSLQTVTNQINSNTIQI